MLEISLEIAVDCPRFAEQSTELADRFEICCDLQQEGWTASSDLMQRFADSVGDQAMLHALIRPRVEYSRSHLDRASFQLDEESLSRSLAQIEIASRTGMQGVVIGPCTSNGQIDVASTRILCDLARHHQLEVGFHRAFDLLEDRHQAVVALSEMGVVRILSSGARGWNSNQSSLTERVRLLRSLSELGSNLPERPIKIVACGGIRASNAALFLAATGHLHSSCRRNGRADVSEARAIAEVVAIERRGTERARPM